MRTFWKLIVGVGIILLLVSTQFNTSVSTGYGRVHNIGLMNNKQNFILIAGIILIVGVLMVLFGKSNKSETNSDLTSFSPANASTRACPFCAEPIRAEAIICRFCQRDVPLVKECGLNSGINKPSANPDARGLCSNCSAEMLVSEKSCRNCTAVFGLQSGFRVVPKKI